MWIFKYFGIFLWKLHKFCLQQMQFFFPFLNQSLGKGIPSSSLQFALEYLKDAQEIGFFFLFTTVRCSFIYKFFWENVVPFIFFFILNDSAIVLYCCCYFFFTSQWQCFKDEKFFTFFGKKMKKMLSFLTAYLFPSFHFCFFFFFIHNVSFRCLMISAYWHFSWKLTDLGLNLCSIRHYFKCR